jgi:hypothetical protein
LDGKLDRWFWLAEAIESIERPGVLQRSIVVSSRYFSSEWWFGGSSVWMSTRQSECVGAGSLVPPSEGRPAEGSMFGVRYVWIVYGIFP